MTEGQLKNLRAAISVAQMCKLLGMSRSQFNSHVHRGTFHPPLYLVKNKRPFYIASMAEENLTARQTGIGVNGQYVLFYERHVPSQPKPRQGDRAKPGHTKLLASLRSLGLETVSPEQVQVALSACFPSGTSGHDEAEVLRVVFRHLKRAEAG